ncbi:MAG: GNAT family N-acetyltransferase, partial [Candidatus Cloacimonetes bacterium]|nr:GNAT family N-acetyltransferase [Candidatus Cloacimonadota bacterium]
MRRFGINRMTSKVLSLNDSLEWRDYLNILPLEQHDAYYSPEYYSMYEANGDGIAKCFVFEDKNDLAIYPFLQNSVNKLGYTLDAEYSDIQGAYGYNGVITSSYETEFKKKFFEAFSWFCSEENIIAEFNRFNPINGNHLFEIRTNPINVLDNVLIDLTLDVSEIWMESFDNGVRKAVKKAERNGLIYQCISGNEINELQYKSFLDIYLSTMRRNNADEYYFFSEMYFEKLFDNLKPYILLSIIEMDGKAISVELDLVGAKNCYGFLGGTLSDYYSYSPNSLLR